MQVMTRTRRRYTLLWLGLLLTAACLMMPGTGWSAPGNSLYYRIGGGSPISVSAGRGYQPGKIGLGVSWGMGSACSGLNPMLTIGNQLNGVTQGFQNMMGSVIQNATSAVAALPAMIIQRAAPGLYDLLSNGVLQGKLNFDKAQMSCKAMAKRAADVLMSGGWQRQAQAQNWEQVASTTGDAVKAQEIVEAEAGDKGVTWVGGDKYGGTGQQPIQVVRDTAVAGYDLLHGRSNSTSTQPVAGGGQGWGSVPTASGTWPGAGGNGSGGIIGGTSGCSGGMCTVWGSPTEAADWIAEVLGEREIRTCNGCEKAHTQAGTGLIRMLEKQQQHIQQKLTAMVNGGMPVTADNLSEVSAGAGLMITSDVIAALRMDPKAGVLTHRLAAEMALARTLTQAIWGRRVMLAGASEPGIANNENGQKAIDDKLTQLDRGIQALRIEMQVREALADNTATVILARRHARNQGMSVTEARQLDPVLDSRDGIEP